MMSVRFQFLDVYLGATLVGRLSKTGDIVQFLGDESYLENPHRPTLSLSYNSLDEITGDADTREIFTKSGTRSALCPRSLRTCCLRARCSTGLRTSGRSRRTTHSSFWRRPEVRCQARS